MRHRGLFVVCLFVFGCDAGFGGSRFGATPGGVQDMGLARQLIEDGRVPPAAAFTVEGMFSEHDLPLQSAPCHQTLCIDGAIGVAPTLDDQPMGWLQIGLSSTVDPDRFVRPSLTLIALMQSGASQSDLQ